jgi:hypothetical protein
MKAPYLPNFSFDLEEKELKYISSGYESEDLYQWAIDNNVTYVKLPSLYTPSNKEPLLYTEHYNLYLYTQTNDFHKFVYGNKYNYDLNPLECGFIVIFHQTNLAKELFHLHTMNR